MREQNQPGTRIYVYILFFYIPACFGSLAIITDKANIMGRYAQPLYRQAKITAIETSE